MNFLYTMTIDSFVPILRNLSSLLDKAVAFAASQGIDEGEIVAARLAPDMFSLGRQIQAACDHAKNTRARLAGQTAPIFPDEESTLAQFKVRIAATIAYLETAQSDDFIDAENRHIEIPLPNAKMVLALNGLQLLRDFALPNFYFHVVTAYDILRHKGVELSKRDYLAHNGPYFRPM